MEKILLSLIMLSLISSGSGYNNWQLIDDNLNGISHATARVISDICGENKKLSMLIFHNKHYSNPTFMHEINHILRESSRDFKISLRITTSSNNASFRAKCNVIITSSCEEFMALYDDAFIASLDNEHSPLLIVLLGTSDSHKVVTVFDYLWNASVYNVNVMLKESDGSVSVLTYFPFQGHHCSDTNPMLINEFRDGNFVNSTNEFFPSKMDDLQKCPIRVATSNNSDPYIFTTTNANGSVELYGRDITILHALAGSLNFEINYTYVGKEGVLLENGTAEGTYKRLLDGRADIAIADMWLKANRLKFIDATSSYIRQQIAFVIPPGAELTSFEKYLRPMDTWTWILTLATMIVAFLVIFIAKRKSLYIQNLIFGEKVQDPYLNVFVGLFGGSQTTLPHRNFPRFILMMFLIFCLIIRTLYQGSLYRFLQTKIYHKEVQSIDEMIERDYKFYVVPSILDLIEGHPRIYERRIVMTLEQRKKLYGRANDPSFKGAFFRSLTGVLYENQKNFNGTRYLLCKEEFLTIPVVIYVRKGFYLLHALNEHISRLEAGGLIRYWHSQIIDERYLKIIESQEPSVIELHHLSGGFVLWLIGCLIATLAFICEILYARCTSH